MVDLLQFLHTQSYPLLQLLSPLQQSCHSGHVLVDHWPRGSLKSLHLPVKYHLGLVQLLTVHIQHDRVLVSEVFLDDGSLEKRSHHLEELEDALTARALVKGLAHDVCESVLHVFYLGHKVVVLRGEFLQRCEDMDTYSVTHLMEGKTGTVEPLLSGLLLSGHLP